MVNTTNVVGSGELWFTICSLGLWSIYVLWDFGLLSMGLWSYSKIQCTHIKSLQSFRNK